MKKLLLYSLAFLSAGMLTLQAQQVTPTFTGTVTDANNQPLANIPVMVNVYPGYTGYSGFTNSSGIYTITLPSIPAYQYTYSVTAYSNMFNCSDSVFGVIPGNPGSVTFTNDLQLPCNSQVNCNVAWGWNYDSVNCELSLWHQGQNTSQVTWYVYSSNMQNYYTSNQHFPTFSLSGPATVAVYFQLDSCPLQGDTFAIASCTPQPNCNYSWNYQPGNNIYTYYFTPTVNSGTSFLWDFGDGTSSTQQSPIHQFPGPGWYNVCLTIDSCPAWCDSFYVQPLGNNCNIAWGWNYDSLNCQFQFWHQGQNTSQVQWIFYTSNSQYDTSFQHFPVYGWNVPGTYMVCFQIDNCPVQCDTIVVPNCNGCNSGFVCGSVIAGNSPGFPAQVYLIQYDPQTNQLTALQTTSTNQSGAYCFDTIPNGTYLVKAALTPNSNVWSSYLPTYYGNVLFWSQALLSGYTASVNCNQVTADIQMIPGNNPGGPGFIGGSVLQGANLVDNTPDVPAIGPVAPGEKAAGDPVPDVSVLLLDQNSNPVTHAITDANGEYSFSGLAYGTYELHPDVPGLVTIPIYVTISSNSPSANGQDFTINTTYVAGLEEESGNVNAMSVYPNPVGDATTLYLDMKAGAEMEIMIYSMTGSLTSAQVQKLGSGVSKVSLDTSVLSAGLYTIAVRDITSGHTGYIKIVK